MKKIAVFLVSLGFGLCFAFSCKQESGKKSGANQNTNTCNNTGYGLTGSPTVQSLFQARCIQCHGYQATKPRPNYADLSNEVTARAAGAAIMSRIELPDTDQRRMPPPTNNAMRLDYNDINMLKGWAATNFATWTYGSTNTGTYTGTSTYSNYNNCY